MIRNAAVPNAASTQEIVVNLGQLNPSEAVAPLRFLGTFPGPPIWSSVMICFWHVKRCLMDFAELFPHLLLFVGTEVTLGCNKRKDFSRIGELSNKIVKEIGGRQGGEVHCASPEG